MTQPPAPAATQREGSLQGPVTTTDYHTGGEPFRIVTGGVPELLGARVADRRLWARDHLEDVRRLLVNEPRGHADMYGCFLTPPDDEGAALGTVFFHNEGYSTACGHGTIALATWAIETGQIPVPAGVDEARFAIDVPSGRLPVTVAVDRSATTTDGRPTVESVSFANVPAFVASTVQAPLPDGRHATGAVAFGGAFYAVFQAADFDLSISREDLPVIIELCRGIKGEINAAGGPIHPEDERLADIYGVILVDEVDPAAVDLGILPQGLGEDAIIQRNVTVFADGEVDRSPTGSGTSARLAVLHAAGQIRVGQELVNLSIVNSAMTGVITGSTTVGDHQAVDTVVTGTAFATGEHVFTMDPRDPLGTGFLLR